MLLAFIGCSLSLGGVQSSKNILQDVVIWPWSSYINLFHALPLPHHSSHTLATPNLFQIPDCRLFLQKVLPLLDDWPMSSNPSLPSHITSPHLEYSQTPDLLSFLQTQFKHILVGPFFFFILSFSLIFFFFLSIYPSQLYYIWVQEWFCLLNKISSIS